MFYVKKTTSYQSNMGLNKVAKTWISIVISMLICSTLTGCDKMAEKATEVAIEKALESETGANVDIDTNNDGKITITTEDGTITTDNEDEQLTYKDADGNVMLAAGESVKIPDDFPKDVPLPTNFNPNSTMKLEDNNYMLMGEVKGSVESVQTELKQKLATTGWKDGESLNSADMVMMGMEKDNRVLSYTIQADDTELISVMVAVGNKS